MNSLENNLNSKHKFKINTNLFKLESKFSTKNNNKHKKNTLYKKLYNGVYSSNNNLKHFKTSNGIFLKFGDKSKISEDRINSSRKRNYRRKFNNLSDISNLHNSENKIKKFNKIFLQKKGNNIINSNSSKLDNNLNYKSSFINYNNNINSKERKNTNSKNKSIKIKKKNLNIPNKYTLYNKDEGISSFEYDIKNDIKNKKIIMKMNTVQSLKNNYHPQAKYIRQIKKNNNYIHIKKKIVKPSNDKRNQTKSINKNKKKQKSIGAEELLNLKEYKNSINLNGKINSLNQINKTSILNDDKHILSNINKQKINMKKNKIHEENSNPLVNIRNTFISFNMYPKYFVDQKKKLSSPKIDAHSPKNKKYKKINTNLKMFSNKKNILLPNNNHFRQNTSPGLDSSGKKCEFNDFTNIQQNIFNSIDNQKLFYYTNTEYDENNSISKNINLDIVNNMKNKLINKKYKSFYKDIYSNNKINNKIYFNSQSTNIRNKNLANTLSPNNAKKIEHKININKNFLDDKTITKNDRNKKRNFLANYINYKNDKDKKKREIDILESSHDFNYMKKNNIIDAIEKINCNTTTNKGISSKYGIKFKMINKNNFNPSKID